MQSPRKRVSHAHMGKERSRERERKSSEVGLVFPSTSEETRGEKGRVAGDGLREGTDHRLPRGH